MTEFHTKRIVNLDEQSEPQSGDYIVTDNQTSGTKKTPASALAKAADLAAEQTAREEADDALTESITALSDEVDEQGALIQNPTKTVSGEVAHFTDGAEMPAKSVIVNIAPKQSGSGTPSPDNVRPISGWESVSVFDANKNLLPITMETRTVNGITFTVEKDASGNVLSIAFSGTTASTVTEVGLGATPPLKGGAYIINGCSNPNISIRLQLKKKGEAAAIVQQFDNNDVSFTAIDGTEYVVTICIVGNGMAVNATIYPMIRPASITDPTYEPYTGTTTPVSLGRTVYGGTLDVVTGVLTDNDGIPVVFNSANSSIWSGVATSTQGVTRFFTTPTYAGRSIVASDAYRKSTEYATEKDIITLSNDGRVIITPTFGQGKTLDEFKALLADHPFNVLMTLATPQTYQLTPTEVNTLLGENNVWADAGAVEVTYRRDINLALEQLEALMNGTETATAQPTASTAETSEA